MGLIVFYIICWGVSFIYPKTLTLIIKAPILPTVKGHRGSAEGFLGGRGV